MTEEIRPICLYVETCLDKKEGTRDCAKCEHHLSYWTEVMMRDMEKNITRLEQENRELKELNKKICEDCSKEIKVYWNALEEIMEINNKWLKRWRDDSDELAGFEEIENRINEVLE